MDSKKVHDLFDEYTEIYNNVGKALRDILLNNARIEKHPSYTWADEDVNEHLFKGVRHVLTYMSIRDGYQKEDGEDHLAEAVCRLSMALSVRARKCSDEMSKV